ncbi:hypothetical protein [Falsarthrobacter nasiphocae]|uniref:Lipoprotein n=1 Tax=Falsarthrobacter nasiphocae TaxID=189863 RepID=A0AAE3YH37_9MICC|nr:hypothetical protein [Falsarthrobacter nasiphocae]MDR6892167.1 hypothetical protein [Falsarthrobacter nasiphocae]
MSSYRSLLVIAVASLLAVSGCTTTPANAPQDQISPTPTKARLDPSTGAITLPLNAYAPTVADKKAGQKAIDLAMRACMKPTGVIVPDTSVTIPEEDRIYGIWSKAKASKYGYQLPPREGSEDLDLSTLSATQNQAWDDCLNRLNGVPGANLPGVTLDSLSEQLRLKARLTAQANPAWNEYVGAWKTCLRSKGHHIEDGAEKWSPDKPDGLSRENEIRMAVDDVACKESTGMIQKLADLEASYQQTLVTQNEAALKAQRDAIDKEVAAAKRYAATHSAQ